MLKKIKKFFIKFFHLEPVVTPKDVMSHPDEVGEGLVYKLTVNIDCTDVPPQENITETVVVSFRATNKEEAVSWVFRILASSWKELKVSLSQFSKEKRAKNDE